MDDTFYDVRGDNFVVERVSGTTRVHDNDHNGNEGKKRHQDQENKEKRNPKEFMHTIASAVKASNEQLVKKGSKYRFCVYEEKGNVMIDLVLLDDNGKIIKEVKKNITNDDFDMLINNIASIEGLLFDDNG